MKKLTSTTYLIIGFMGIAMTIWGLLSQFIDALETVAAPSLGLVMLLTAFSFNTHQTDRKIRRLEEKIEEMKGREQ